MSPWTIAAIAIAVVTGLAFLWLMGPKRRDTLEVGAPGPRTLEIPLQAPRPAGASDGGSVADEIDKLWTLKEEGALTAEEFEAQKARLLSGQAPTPGAAGGYQVVLIDPGENKINAIKLVRELTHGGLKETKDLVESPPQVVAEGLTQAQAEGLKAQFNAIGATVELR